jgi:hypothetical protein
VISLTDEQRTLVFDALTAADPDANVIPSQDALTADLGDDPRPVRFMFRFGVALARLNASDADIDLLTNVRMLAVGGRVAIRWLDIAPLGVSA